MQDAKVEPRPQRGERGLCGELSPGRSKQKGKFGETSVQPSGTPAAGRTAREKCPHSYSLLLENSYFLYNSHHLPVCHGYFGQRWVDWYGDEWL